MAKLRLKAYLAVAMMISVVACKKDKPAPAVVEETPSESIPQNTDTSAVMQEEPALSQVGGSSRKGKNTASSMGEPAGIVKNGRFVVQVSVFKSSNRAGALVEKLAAQGYPAYVAEVQDPTPEMSGTWHRVRVGTFQSLADAKSFGENTLKPMGYDFWVDKKSMDNVGAREGGGSSPSYSAPSEPTSGYTPEPTPAPSSMSITPSTPEPPSVTEPPAPSQPSAPASNDWNSTPAPTTPEPPAPSSSQGWGTPSETTTPTEPAPGASPSGTSPNAPADTGAVKLDDW